MILFYIIWALWFGSEVFLNLSLRSKEKGKAKQNFDKGSMAIIWRVIGITNTIAILSALFIAFPLSMSFPVQYIGLLIVVLGLILRIYSVLVLGRYFTVDVNISNDHILVDNGVYKFIRHPSYLGSIISFTGFGLSLNNWISFVIIIIAIPAVMIYRIKIEEKALSERFGADYELYKRSTKRLIPFIY
jgi:protein-S-isoprenylcysteine O-methyltransferase Ste14